MMFLQTIKYHLMNRSRSNKYDLFLAQTCIEKSSQLLDVGVADSEYSPYDNFLEKHYPYAESITALSIFPLDEFRERYPKVKTVVFAGGTFPFFDNQFDVVHSNAVIEHVGSFDKQVDFVKEIVRVGLMFYFTTPSRFFPVETHTNLPFLHYLPKAIFDRILRMLGKSWATGGYMNLLSKRDLVRLMESAGIVDYRIFTKRLLGFPLHYTVTGKKAFYNDITVEEAKTKIIDNTISPSGEKEES